MAKWSEERIKQLLGSFNLELPFGSFQISEVKNLKGESSVSIRKAKKIVSFDYNIELKWEAKLKDGSGNKLGEVKGEMHFPEVSNDVHEEGDDFEVRIGYSKGEEFRERIDKYIRKDAVQGLRIELEVFIKELKEK